ncbi:Panacea domain-containing protein [Crenothrix sp.]|uniref:Panacea domain-containing protein n=1 Tax=Crenothrix sp. TaxID=3100433 RepID=UPI00374D9D5C
MLIDHSRQKLINAIIYFVTNTKSCGKIKLFKLLYFLDFEHYSRTGRNVTGLDYFAWPMGPVPAELNNELTNPSSDFSQALEVRSKKIAKGNMLNINPLVSFSADFFSKREIKLLEQLASEFKNSYAKDMVEATHLENLPWHEIYEKQGLKQQQIPYELALNKAELGQISKNVNEHLEFKANYR